MIDFTKMTDAELFELRQQINEDLNRRRRIKIQQFKTELLNLLTKIAIEEELEICLSDSGEEFYIDKNNLDDSFRIFIDGE